MTKTSRAIAHPTGNRAAILIGMALLVAAGLMLSACNTTNGAGQDISAAGRGVSTTASDVQKKL